MCSSRRRAEIDLVGEPVPDDFNGLALEKTAVLGLMFQRSPAGLLGFLFFGRKLGLPLGLPALRASRSIW